MINEVSVTVLIQFLGLYFPSKIMIRLTDDVFLISLLVRIVSRHIEGCQTAIIHAQKSNLMAEMKSKN